MTRTALRRRSLLARQGTKGRAKAKRMRALKRVLIELRGARCERCGKARLPQTLDVHHKRFASHGGADTPENCVLLDRRCHDEIHFHIAEDWAKWVA